MTCKSWVILRQITGLSGKMREEENEKRKELYEMLKGYWVYTYVYIFICMH